ncbi:MAG TPA: B12-binding domain-containing radical SAM protein, partial [Deltaproteobacteria bacterium]|nr:B12-binding domain-containing radical SAM protein [Deltaproteobacteria bacterium]
MHSGPLHAQQWQSLLRNVEKPGRYLGNEVNSIRKDPARVKLHVALVFPDVYEMGESHVGLKILYDILNRDPEIWAERVYAPWTDMEAELIRSGLPLFSLESKRPLRDFDLIGITLPYELVYTNILTILDRGGVPLWQKDRKKGDPIVLGGGSCAFNPEPVA